MSRYIGAKYANQVLPYNNTPSASKILSWNGVPSIKLKSYRICLR